MSRAWCGLRGWIWYLKAKQSFQIFHVGNAKKYIKYLIQKGKHEEDSKCWHHIQNNKKLTSEKASLVAQTKEFACNARDPGSIPGSGRSPGEGNGNPLQYSSLENPVDRGAWQAIVHGVAKSQDTTERVALHFNFRKIRQKKEKQVVFCAWMSCRTMLFTIMEIRCACLDLWGCTFR